MPGTGTGCFCNAGVRTINLPGTGTGCFHGLELLHHVSTKPGIPIRKFQCPHGLELLPNNYDEILEINLFQCPHGLELLPLAVGLSADIKVVSMPSRAWVVTIAELADKMTRNVSMPSRAWVVTWYWGTIYNSVEFQCPHGLELLPDLADSAFDVNSFNALTGLSCYSKNVQYFKFFMILFMHTCYL